jgi:hypothetical protein
MSSHLPEVPPVYNSPVKEPPLPKLLIKLQWLLLKILILVATGVAGVLVGQRLSAPKRPSVVLAIPTPTPIRSEVDNWKTYSNPNFGLSFQYPQEWPDASVEAIMSNSGKLYDQVSFGEKLTVRIRGESTNTPYSLSEYANNPVAKNVSLEKYPAVWVVQSNGDIQIDIAEDLKTIKIVSLVFPFGTSEDLIIKLLPTFTFTSK